MQLLATLIVCLTPVATGGPATQPATPAPAPWERTPKAFPALAGELDGLARLQPQHHQNWQKYHELEMTPVDDTAEFRAALRAVLPRGAEHWPALPLDEEGNVIEPIPAAPAAAPDGPMTQQLYDRLTDAVLDQLLAMQDRPFAFQRERWFKHRRVLLQFPDNNYDISDNLRRMSEKHGEAIDPDTLDTKAEKWALIERFYNERRAAAGGGYMVTGAALDASSGVRLGVFTTSDPADKGRIAYSLVGPDYDYWFGDLIACGLRLSWPPVSNGQIIERDGKILRCDLLMVLETANGDRAPVAISAYFDPQAGPDGRWEIESCCFTSSPYAAAVGWVR